MKKVAVILVAMVVMLSFSMVGIASDQNTMGTQQQQTTPEKMMGHKESLMIYRGEVAAIDHTAHTVVVKGKEGEKTFDVSRATMRGKVEPEQYVSVRYTEANGKMVAASITAVSHKASGDMKKLSEAENALYAGIGDAMIWGFITFRSCPA